MVADCHQILVNGGIFMFPPSSEHPQGKLNFIIQIIPLCFIFKAAGGIGLNYNFKPILDDFKDYNLINYNCLKLSNVILCSENEYKNITNILDIQENLRC